MYTVDSSDRQLYLYSFRLVKNTVFHTTSMMIRLQSSDLEPRADSENAQAGTLLRD